MAARPPQPQPPAEPPARRFPWWLAIVVAGSLALAFFFLPRSDPNAKPVPLSAVAQEVRNGNVQSVEVAGERLTVKLKDGSTQISNREPDASLTESLARLGVSPEQLTTLEITSSPPSGFALGTLLIWLLPLLLLVGLMFSMRRSIGGGAEQAFSFARSRARRVTVDRPDVRFSDVAGADEAKQELSEVVDFLKDPARFVAVGARIPKGVLLVGPPGTGKTMLARAVAGEAQVPFFSVSGSEFVELFVGVGAARVRDLFEQAKKTQPAIMFIDEIDAVGRQRGAGLGGGNDEREQTLNQILTEMDGFEKNATVVVMAATNRPDVLDPALLRPGRFDRRVMMDLPDLAGREQILKIHARGKPLGPDVDLYRVAQLTPGFSGADLENLLNEAALLTARGMKKQVGEAELEEAIDRVMAGPARRGRRISEEERRRVAYHEAGHALTAQAMPHADPVHKISIVARGGTGGHTRLLPEEDRSLWTREQLRDSLAYALGGMAAEEIIFGEPSTGSGNDLQVATTRAREMVRRYGMSERLGPIGMGSESESVFLGRELMHSRDYSDATAAEIDAEVRSLLREALDRAKRACEVNRDYLDALVRSLLEVETLKRDDVARILTGVRREDGSLAPPPALQPAAAELQTPVLGTSDVTESAPTPI
jgi:cell division protease FtsH